MSRRGDDLDSEASEVPSHRLKDVDIGFAGIAAAGADLPQLERTAEKLEEFRFEGLGELDRIGRSDDQSVAVPGRQTVVRAERDRPLGTGRLAFGAEEAASQIERGPLGAQPEGIR